MERLDVRGGAARVRARHGRAGVDVVQNLPLVAWNLARRRHRRPRRYDVDPRRR